MRHCQEAALRQRRYQSRRKADRPGAQAPVATTRRGAARWLNKRPLAQPAPAGSTGAQQAIGMPLTGQVWPQWLHHGKSNEATGGWNPFQAELSW